MSTGPAGGGFFSGPAAGYGLPSGVPVIGAPNLVNFEIVSADPRIAGLARAIGSTAVLLSGGSVVSVFQKVGAGTREWIRRGADTEVLTVASALVEFDGLSGDEDKAYDFALFLVNAAGSTAVVSIEFNGSSSDFRRTFSGENAGGGYIFGAGASNQIGDMRATNPAMIWGRCYVRQGALRQYFATSCEPQGAGSNPYMLHLIGQYEIINTEITKVGFRSSVAASFAAGSVFVLSPSLLPVT